MSIKTELLEAVRNLTNACTELVLGLPIALEDSCQDIGAEDIKACPFCGYEDCAVDSCSMKYYITCPNCEADGPMCESVDDAVRMWNNAREGRD